MKKKYFLHTLLFIVLSIYLNAHAEQPIYKHMLPNGEVKYSNQGGPGAERVELAPMAPPHLQIRPRPTFVMPDTMVEAVPSRYQINFVTPQNEQTFTVGQPTVDITLSTSPALYTTDQVQLFLDNIPYGNLQSELTYSLSNLNRGAHSLQAKIYSNPQKGASKGETGVIVIYIQRPSIQNPPH